MSSINSPIRSFDLGAYPTVTELANAIHIKPSVHFGLAFGISEVFVLHGNRCLVALFLFGKVTILLPWTTGGT